MVVSVVLGATQMGLSLPFLDDGRFIETKAFVVCNYIAITSVLIYYVSRGSTVALVTYAALLIFGLFRSVESFGWFIRAFPLAPTVALGSVAAQVCAIYLLHRRPLDRVVCEGGAGEGEGAVSLVCIPAGIRRELVYLGFRIILQRSHHPSAFLVAPSLNQFCRGP
jgi:hypothetical protein